MSLIIVKQPNDAISIFSDTYSDFLYLNLEIGMFLRIQKKDRLVFRNAIEIALQDAEYALYKHYLGLVLLRKGKNRESEIIQAVKNFKVYTVDEFKKAAGIV
jgi:hypothetical protein